MDRAKTSWARIMAIGLGQGRRRLRAGRRSLLVVAQGTQGCRKAAAWNRRRSNRHRGVPLQNRGQLQGMVSGWGRDQFSAERCNPQAYGAGRNTFSFSQWQVASVSSNGMSNRSRLGMCFKLKILFPTPSLVEYNRHYKRRALRAFQIARELGVLQQPTPHSNRPQAPRPWCV